MCLRGLGARTKDGAVLLTMAASGGAVAPAIMNAVIHQRGVRYSFCIVVAFFAFGSVFPAYTALVRAAKQQLDPVRESGKLPMARDRPATAEPGYHGSGTDVKREAPAPELVHRGHDEGRA